MGAWGGWQSEICKRRRYRLSFVWSEPPSTAFLVQGATEHVTNTPTFEAVGGAWGVAGSLDHLSAYRILPALQASAASFPGRYEDDNLYGHCPLRAAHVPFNSTRSPTIPRYPYPCPNSSTVSLNRLLKNVSSAAYTPSSTPRQNRSPNFPTSSSTVRSSPSTSCTFTLAS